MTFPRPKDPLLAAGQLLAMLMQGLMALAAVAVIIALPLALIFQNELTAELRNEFADPSLTFPILGIAALLLVLAVIVALAFFFFGRLRQIIASVGEGDPFIPENAERLTLMAWLMLAIQLAAIPAQALAIFLTQRLEGAEAEIDGGFDLNGVLIVILLFILARIFRQGTAMRADLEGTV